MGCRSYTYLKLTILREDAAARAEGARFARAHGWHVEEDAHGRTVLRAEVSSGWLSDVMHDLEAELSGLELPTTAWELEADFYSEEDAHDDGAAAKVRVSGGKIAGYLESRTVFVEAEPPKWLAFELDPEGRTFASDLPKPDMTYGQMVAEAKPRQAEFQETMDRFLRDSANRVLDDQATRLACRLTGYCDAIADMFGIGYDAVYQDVHDAYIDHVNERNGLSTAE